MCFFNSEDEAYLEQREPMSSLKNLSSRKDSIQKLTQLAQAKNVLYAPASNTHGFLSRDTSVSSTHLNRPIWKN
jgi:hypothetical protein